MYKNWLNFSVFLVLVLLVLSCAPQVAQETISRAPVSPEKTLSQTQEIPAWQAMWDNVLREAKREGKVVIYTSAGSSLIAAMQKGFQQKYGIKAEFLPGRGEEATEKLKALRRAGIYDGDFFIGGSTIPLALMKPFGLLDKLEPMLLLPEFVEPELIKKNWWLGAMRWLDRDRTSLAFTSWALAPMTFNTTLAKKEELASWRELLNPKWKGKIVIDDPTITGSGAKVIGVLGEKIMGWDFVRELAKNEPAIQRDIRLYVEWVARGKYAIALGAKPETVLEFQKAGSPLQITIPKEGTYLASGSGVISPLSNVPHPNAAKIFVNWLLTQEGQTIFSQAYGVPSVRLDVVTTGFDPIILLQPGMPYIISDDEEFIALQPQHMKMAKEIFSVSR